MGWAEAKSLFLWSKQREILRAVVDHRNVAVHACHAVGKTRTAATAMCWWIDSRTPGKARAFSTAPSFFQVKSLLWSEMGRLHSLAQMPGRCNTVELVVPDEHGNDFLAAWGRKPKDVSAGDASPATFQGVHDVEGVLIVVDESAGVAASLLEDADKNLTGPDDRMLLIGNPDDPTSYFARICRGEIPGWHVIHMDAFESPNWTGEVVPSEVARALVSKEWAAAQAAKFGEESPTYQARVRGVFPEDASDAVVPVSLRARASIPMDDPILTPRVLGVDVGGGSDWTVCQLRTGQLAARSWRFRSRDPQATASDIVAIVVESEATRVRIDSIGIGWGVAGALREAASRGEHHATVELVNVSETASEPKRFVNRRSEMWWNARELSERGDWSLAALSGDALEQLTWPRWSSDPKGRVRVEPKDETIRRHGHSPDDADALLMAFYDVVAGGGEFQSLMPSDEPPVVLEMESGGDEGFVGLMPPI